MNLAFSQMKKLFAKFNEKAYAFDDFLRICRRERINVVTYKMPESVRGYYCSERKRIYRKKWIVFNELLTETQRLYVAYHELAHHFLHVQLASKQTFYCRLARLEETRHDCEAEAISLMFILPAAKLVELYETPFDELYPFTQEMLIKRQRIFEQNDFGILSKKFLPARFHG